MRAIYSHLVWITNLAHKRFSGQENYIVLFSCGTKAGNPTWLGYQNIMISFLLPTSGTSHKINHVYEEMLQEQLGICHV